MAIQSEIFSTQYGVRKFTSTKHIATERHMAVWLQRVSDGVWEQLSIDEYDLFNNSAVLEEAPDTTLYSQIEIRVADTTDELSDSPSDISTVAGIADDISILVENIDLINAKGDEAYLVSELPLTGNEGDLVVNVIDGGIYEWQTDAWVLIAQSDAGDSNSIVIPFEPQLPNAGIEGEFIYNTADGKFYAFIDGEWGYLKNPPEEGFGIPVYETNPTTDNFEGRVIFNTTENKMYKFTNGAWSAVVEPISPALEIADASITTAKFAAGITALEVVDTIPTTDNFLGRLIYLTSDGKIYRYKADGFSADIDTTNLSGTITETQIEDNAITTAKIATNAITANEITAGSITTTKIASNSITAGLIQAGAIGASQIASQAITSEKIFAGAVTAEKITAGSITSDKIASNAISADKIQANAITVGKIASGAISTEQLSANCVTANQIATGAITASKISAGAITVDKIASGLTTLTDGSFALGTGATINQYQGVGAFTTNNVDKYAILATHNANGASIGASSFGSGNNAQGAVFVNATSTAHSTFNTVIGLGKYSRAMETLGDVFVTGNLTATGSIYPFTGSHYAIISKDVSIELGDCVAVVDTFSIGISETYNRVDKTSRQNDNAVFGVISYIAKDTAKEAKQLLEQITNTMEYKVPLDKKHVYDLLISGDYVLIGCNALGEGMMKVTNTNGLIQRGDYITSSIVDGVGCKQDDDVLHNYTIGKALEDQTQANQLIACTYHCG